MFDKQIILPENDIVLLEQAASETDAATLRNDAAIRQREQLFPEATEPKAANANAEALSLSAGDLTEADRVIPRVALNESIGTPPDEPANEDEEPGNSTPNGAYPINMDTVYVDSITGAGYSRWYYFQLTEEKKVTVYMSPESSSTIDNAIALYSLDLSTGQLSMVAASQKPAGFYELMSYVAEPGYYFLAVIGYAGTTANQYSFLATLSSSWDAVEGDDSYLQAPMQPLNAAVTHTLDNAYDEDWSSLTVSTSGLFTINLYGVPDNLNYTLQLLDTNLQLLQTINPNEPQVKTIPAGSYWLRAFATDYVVDPAAEFKVMVTSIPATVDITDPSRYGLWRSNDNKHIVEAMSADGIQYFVAINGALFDYNGLDFETTRASHNNSTSNSNCSMAFASDHKILFASFCDYAGSNEPRAQNLSNTIVLQFNAGIYGETHKKVSYSLSGVYGAHQIVTSTDANHMTYYTGYWSYAGTQYYPVLIIDLDTGAAADFSNPNWYFGNNSFTGYGKCTYAEYPSVDSDYQPEDIVEHRGRWIGNWTPTTSIDYD